MKITKLNPGYYTLLTEEGAYLDFTEAFTGQFTVDAESPQVSLRYEGSDIAILYKLEPFVQACQKAGIELCQNCSSITSLATCEHCGHLHSSYEVVEEWRQSVSDFLDTIRPDSDIVKGPFEGRAFYHFYHQAKRELARISKGDVEQVTRRKEA